MVLIIVVSYHPSQPVAARKKKWGLGTKLLRMAEIF